MGIDLMDCFEFGLVLSGVDVVAEIYLRAWLFEIGFESNLVAYCSASPKNSESLVGPELDFLANDKSV